VPPAPAVAFARDQAFPALPEVAVLLALASPPAAPRPNSPPALLPRLQRRSHRPFCFPQCCRLRPRRHWRVRTIQGSLRFLPTHLPMTSPGLTHRTLPYCLHLRRRRRLGLYCRRCHRTRSRWMSLRPRRSRWSPSSSQSPRRRRHRFPQYQRSHLSHLPRPQKKPRRQNRWKSRGCPRPRRLRYLRNR
jgi:hypothetical protein